MKIRKIIDICKKNGNIIIFESGKEQWISDGAAVFPMFNLPQFDEDSLCRTYDITDKQAAKIHFRHEYTMPAAVRQNFTINENSYPKERRKQTLNGFVISSRFARIVIERNTKKSAATRRAKK